MPPADHRSPGQTPNPIEHSAASDQTLPPWISDASTSSDRPAARLRLKVVPGAKTSQIVGPLGDRLKLRVAAPPEDGKANNAVINLLAQTLGLRVDRIHISAGRSSPEKEATIQDTTAHDAAMRLAKNTNR